MVEYFCDFCGHKILTNELERRKISIHGDNIRDDKDPGEKLIELHFCYWGCLQNWYRKANLECLTKQKILNKAAPSLARKEKSQGEP